MQRYKITIEYDGTNYFGWQKQATGPTIQSKVEKALKKFSTENIRIYGMGRTDSGVHALEQVAHFDLQKHFTAKQILLGTNFFLKDEKISITSCTEVTDDFHARYSATKRTYRYTILNRDAPPALDINKVWHLKDALNISKMKEAASILVGTHDFTSFRTKLCEANSPIKTIHNINISYTEHKITFEISAPSFLHHMVRNIVGSLVLIGKEEMTKKELEEYLQAKDIEIRKHTAPAHGLCFVKAEYDKCYVLK